jgi:hypothetical protein
MNLWPSCSSEPRAARLESNPPAASTTIHHPCRRLRLKPLLAILLFLAAVTPAVRGQSSVTLAWDPDAGTNIAGYKIYYGVASRTYTRTNIVGNVTNATISGLTSGTVYYFAAAAYDTAGLESDYSTEVVYTTSTRKRPHLHINSFAAGAAAPGSSIVLPPPIPIVLGVTDGEPGLTYNLQLSYDLKAWTQIGAMTLDTNGCCQFTNAVGASGSNGFYRLQGQ